MIELFYYDGTVKKGNAKDLEKLKDRQIWIDTTDITKEESELLKNTFELHPLTTEDLYTFNARIKVEEFSNYLFCVFYGVKKIKAVGLVEIDFILGQNFIITNHKTEIESCTNLKNDFGRIETLFKRGNEFIFHKLLDSEIDNYLPVLEYIDDQIEDIEEKVTENPRPELLTKILKLKRSIVQIKKITLPQREKISFIAKSNYKFISKKAVPYFRDIYDHAIRVSDTIDNYREAIGSTFDAYMSAVSNKMNEVMKVLSIIATIALPLTVISGIYGTNFQSLPGSNIIYGFWIMIFLMILMSLGIIYFFKRRGWF
ncbi:magnesium/cobalt transporter CorA [Chloroflexota bacterium]